MSNSTTFVTLDEARVLNAWPDIPDGDHTISYSDRTHLTDGTYHDILRLTLSTHLVAMGAEKVGYYTIQSRVKSSDKNGRIINDIMAQSFLRVGLVNPQMSDEELHEVMKLRSSDALVLIPDTNALHNGTLHWLLTALRDVQVWVLPVVVSLIQVQSRDSSLKNMMRGGAKPTHLGQALRSRALINGSLGLLGRCRAKYQVLEVDPQLLRYMRPGGRGTADPDEGDVLEDRLLLEAIHGAFRSIRTRAAMRVVTSDVLFARMLHTEGIPSLVLAVPPFPDRPTECVRYDAVAKAFIGAPLHHLLWDLAHTFSAVKLRDATGAELVSLEAYWPLKTPADWEGERLQITRKTPEAPAQPPKAVVFSNAVIPEASFPQVLRVAGVILERPIVGVDQLLETMPDRSRPTGRTARMALEILLRAGFLQREEQSLRPTNALTALSEAVQNESLDDASGLWMSFPPYAALVATLQESGSVRVPDLPSVLGPRCGGEPAKEACDRLSRFPVYLGQAWTDGALLRDGSARPEDEVAAAEWQGIFEQTQQDGFCRIADLLPAFCRKLNQSPWASARQIRRLAEEDRLPGLSFQPAAGKRPITRDEVVRGSLINVSTAPVPNDRIHIGGRPMFSVVRGSS